MAKFGINDILNAKTKAAGQQAQGYKEIYLSPYEVKAAEENTHQKLEGIEELADSFLHVGQEQPTVLASVFAHHVSKPAFNVTSSLVKIVFCTTPKSSFAVYVSAVYSNDAPPLICASWFSSVSIAVSSGISPVKTMQYSFPLPKIILSLSISLSFLFHFLVNCKFVCGLYHILAFNRILVLCVIHIK